MEETLNDRIEKIVSILSKNQSEFAKAIGISTQSLSIIIHKDKKKRSKPGPEILQSIARTFPQVDTLWLLLGIGEIQNDLGLVEPSERELLLTLKRENDFLVKNNDSLLKDKERLWTMIERNGLLGKQRSNELPQVGIYKKSTILFLKSKQENRRVVNFY